MAKSLQRGEDPQFDQVRQFVNTSSVILNDLPSAQEAELKSLVNSEKSTLQQYNK